MFLATIYMTKVLVKMICKAMQNLRGQMLLLRQSRFVVKRVV